MSNAGGGVRARFDSGANNKPMRVRNSIVAFNGRYGVYRPEDDYAFTNNNVYGNVTNYYNCTADAGSISADPLFANPAANDYRLAKGSPSVDAGTNMASVTSDLAGVPRPTRNGWDQGCYEERGAGRIIHQAPVITSSNVTLRGQLVYDGGSNDANVTIYWGPADGGKTAGTWANPGTVGYVTNGGNFQLTITPPSGTIWYRCYATNWYDGDWADASESLEFSGGSATVIWTGAGTNSLASNPSNWFGGTLPQPQDTAKFDSSPSNCTWDAAAPESVTRWEQTALYAGTVTVARGWASGVTVSNDMVIRGGRLTHAANSTQETYRLRFAVGGNFEVGSGAEIDVDGKGYAKGKGPGAGTADLRGGTHGGEGYRATAACYGSVWEPVTLGSGGGGSSGRTGGGAVYLTVGGTATVSGVISASGDGGLLNYGYGGAGGSVFLLAGHVAGSGTIRANGSGAGYDASCGGGGRVAVIVTNDTSFAGLTLTAFGLYGDYYGRSSAAGTVYKESTAHAPQRGILVLDNNGIFTRRARTVIPAAHPLELFSEIVINRAAVLGFDTGDTFDFGSLGNLTFNGPANSFIAVRDLTGITFPASFTITNYTLRVDAPLTQTADWTIATNGSLSHSPYDGSGEAGLDLTLNGNLTVEGTIDVRRSGYLNTSEAAAARGPGFSSGAGGSHGGLGSGAPAGLCYGSILNPAHLGSGTGAGSSSIGGGRVRLVVSGNTAVNGSILVGCFPDNNVNAAGGSLDLQTTTLSGSGTISSTGGRTVNPAATHSEVGGGGGRIRVKLTGSDSFGSVVFAANGGGAGAGAPASVGAAGTIYLEGAGVTSGAGQIVIGNANLTKNRATEFPPLLLNSDDLRRATLIITNGAWVNLTRSLRIGDLRLSANSQLNLNGHTCSVSQATHVLDSTPIGPGALQWISPGSTFTLR